MTFGSGEQVLSEWMGRHARVSWLVDPEPWIVESQLIADLVLPLNLDQNKHSKFHTTLSAARHAQREAARNLPVLL